MGVLKTAGIVAALAIAGVLIAAATRSDTFRVQRSASIKAAPEKIFPLIDDLHRFNTWNPFAQQDPNLKGSYSGAASGKSAAYTFAGNGNVGKGTIEIIDSAPASRVTMTLHMLAPFETRNTVQFLLEPQGELTRVTWAKIIHLFIDMDRMVGSEFDAGLASLKAIAEKTP
ncbi:MAG: polyketide cyclase [Betaproteobacteria bacterium]|nr:MAG: polyketide cyclase [Betaproteobacteria bacterium]